MMHGDFVMTSETSKSFNKPKSATKDSSTPFKFAKGHKGKLTTKQDNPRPIINRDHEYTKICILMGGEAVVKETVENFHLLNKESESRADGIIFNARRLYTLNDRVIKQLFGIGSNRINRIKKNLDKGKPGGLNGYQVCKILFGVIICYTNG